MCWKGEADTCWQHPHSATTTSSIFSEDTTTFIQRAKRPPRHKGTNDKTPPPPPPPTQHDDVGLIYHSLLISASQHKTHEDNAHFSRAGSFGHWATLGPSRLLPFMLRHKRWHIEAGQSLHRKTQMETDTREDTASTQSDGSDRHLSAQQLMHTDTICSTEITLFKTSAFLYCRHACWHENDTLEQH